MDDLSSLRLELEAERSTHRRDNEHLLARASVAEAERDRLREKLDDVGWLRVTEACNPGEGERTVQAIERLARERESAERALAEAKEALAVAADDLGKAANQFAGLRAAQKAGWPLRILLNPERFTLKEQRAREALDRLSPGDELQISPNESKRLDSDAAPGDGKDER